MDRLSIFSKETSTASITTSLDIIEDKLSDVERELVITRKGHEEWTWGEEVEDSEIDLSDVKPKESDDA